MTDTKNNALEVTNEDALYDDDFIDVSNDEDEVVAETENEEEQTENDDDFIDVNNEIEDTSFSDGAINRTLSEETEENTEESEDSKEHEDTEVTEVIEDSKVTEASKDNGNKEVKAKAKVNKSETKPKQEPKAKSPAKGNKKEAKTSKPSNNAKKPQQQKKEQSKATSGNKNATSAKSAKQADKPKTAPANKKAPVQKPKKEKTYVPIKSADDILKEKKIASQEKLLDEEDTWEAILKAKDKNLILQSKINGITTDEENGNLFIVTTYNTIPVYIPVDDFFMDGFKFPRDYHSTHLTDKEQARIDGRVHKNIDKYIADNHGKKPDKELKERMKMVVTMNYLKERDHEIVKKTITYMLDARTLFTITRANRNRLSEVEKEQYGCSSNYFYMVFGSRKEGMILSQKKWFDNPNERRRIKEGDEVQANVLQVTPRGVTVEVCGTESFIETWELSFDYLDDPRLHFKNGDRLNCVVSKIYVNDDGQRKLIVSRKNYERKRTSANIVGVRKGQIYVGTVRSISKDTRRATITLSIGVVCIVNPEYIYSPLPLVPGDKVVCEIHGVSPHGYAFGDAKKF